MAQISNVFNILPDVSSSIVNNSTLIIPSISIGNIPQLAIDLLLHSLDFKKIGSLDDTYLYPFASPVDYSVNKVSTGVSNAIEVYHNTKLNITIVQQRSPIIPSFTKTYVNEIILPFILASNFKKVLILDSSDAGIVENVVPGTLELYTNEDLLNRSLETLNISKQEPASPLDESYNHSNYARVLINALNESKSTLNVDTNVLVAFVYEGDNFKDGELLANKLTDLLGIKSVEKWVRPISWLGVYGDKPVPNAMEDGLFG